MDNQVKNKKRLAKNTIILYCRSIVTILITLFTSRVVLQVLGVADYGIYNVVGGVVAMFSIISGSLTHSISRFLNYELGRGHSKDLNKIFNTSIIILFALGLIVIIIGATVGVWFVNNKLNIPRQSIIAANWVLGCSLIAFIINLLSIPYNAAIVAHEKMSAFAYASIIDVSLKLIIVYLLYLSPIDKLISYSILMVFVSIIMRGIYSIYCNRKFPECKFKVVFDKKIIKDISGFAGLTFFTNGVTMFNSQGVNILINIFFGVTLNAARGIANQAESAIIRFVNDFTTAINPQLIKGYAAGQLKETYQLTCSGARYSYYLFLCMGLPAIIEAPLIMKIWLNNVPDYTVLLFRLSIIGAMIRSLGNTSDIICMATGNIKRYVFIITSISFLVFPLTWLAYKLGAPVETTYILYIVIYSIVTTMRLWEMKRLTGFNPWTFVRTVYIKIILVTSCSILLPLLVMPLMEDNILRLIVTIIVSEISIAISVYYLGLTLNEKSFVSNKIMYFFNK